MQNLHRHTSYSNIFIADSAASNEDYAQRAVELGHKTLSSVEHGWQGNYFQVYELAKKYNLKAVIGAEAYWVKDRIAEHTVIDKNGKESVIRDKSNHHILLLAKSNQGREAINDILSEANITGYYYRPRIDLGLIMSLPPKDVVVTSACIAFNGYDNVDDIILQFADYFGENFMLELQYHDTDTQKDWNQHLISLHHQHKIPITVGLDSHYIKPEDAKLRDYILEAKNVRYEDEEGWYMDYPCDDTTYQRFADQGVLTNEEILLAMNNTDIALDFCDYDTVKIFTKDIKLPTLYPGETKEEKDKRYSRLITKKFKEYMKNVPEEEYQKYFDGVKSEVQTYKDTGMVDYPLLDYAIVNDAIEHGGLITDTGRGSAVGYFTNMLCGFSKVDRFTSAIKLYPERFISTTRILSTKSLPDLDLNTGTPEIFEESQKRILGEEHVAPMIAFGTLKKKSAFKLYARAKNMDFTLANTISEQISQYDEAVKHASDDDRDAIDIYDFVDPQYQEYIEQSKEYWGVVSDKKKAPCAYLLYDGNIRREIGLIKCKSEATKKEYITCVIDGMVAENYKFLKNDILKVDVVLLIDKIFKRIGIEHFDVNELIKRVKDDDKVWDLYAKGYTIGLNQVEQDGSRKRCMNYKPHNISELSAFVAAIRPGFKSMYKKFENREDFSWGIPSLDNLLRTEELPVSFLFFQEQVMSVLNYGGFPLDECYGIIKSIAKKHPEKVRPLKQRFIEGFRDKLIQDEHLSQEDAQKNAEDVWVIINDNCGYGFNSAHAYCMALDSLYQAWQKANYPYEFYEVLLQHYSDKGNKDKVVALKNEMRAAFGIEEVAFKFGDDNRQFKADAEHHRIIPSMTSIKSISQRTAEDLYKLSKNHYDSFFALYCDIIDKTSCNSRQLDILLRLDYFSDFGCWSNLCKQVEIINKFRGEKSMKVSDLDTYGLNVTLVEPFADKITEKTVKLKDTNGLIKFLISRIDVKPPTVLERIQNEAELLGYISLTLPNCDDDYYYVISVKGNTSRMISLYHLKDGQTEQIKVRKACFEKNPIDENCILKILERTLDKKWKKVGDSFERTDEKEMLLTRYTVLKK